MDVGGAEVLAAEYARSTAADSSVVIACLDGLGKLGDQLKAEGYPVEVIGRRPGFDFDCTRRLAKFLREHQVALIHAHQYAPFFYSAASRILRHRTPILFLEHGRDYPDYPRPKRKLANRWLLRRCDRVVAVGQCVRQALIANEGFPPQRVEVVYNGVDLRRYDPQRPEREAVRTELGLAPEQIAVIQVARLNRLKDHGTALRALAQLVARCPQARLILVGDGEERAEIQRLIGELNLGQHVQLLGTRGDVPRLLQAADIFLLSSITEGIALTLIEAMATGLPCVATEVGGNSEVIVNGQTGWLAPARDSEALAGALEKLIAEPADRERLGRAGLERARAVFDDADMHQAYQRIYRSMLGLVSPDSSPNLSRNLSPNLTDSSD